MQKFKDKYGVIPNVSDKDFFTNSVHVPVWVEITPMQKIDIESQLTGYSRAGCITYTELNGSVIPESDLTEYKSVISDVPKNELLSICHTSNNFIKTLITKQNPIENIKADMKLKGLKGKEYVHSIGQWDNYINYLRKELSK